MIALGHIASIRSKTCAFAYLGHDFQDLISIEICSMQSVGAP